MTELLVEAVVITGPDRGRIVHVAGQEGSFCQHAGPDTGENDAAIQALNAALDNLLASLEEFNTEVREATLALTSAEEQREADLI